MTGTPRVHYQSPTVTVWHGDALEALRLLPDASVHSVVCDPPYGLEFMGNDWDGANGFRRSLNAADAGRENVFGRTSRTSPEYRTSGAFQAWCEVWAAECLRILTPGGHLLAFGGSRTWHRLQSGIEDAGFEIRDSIAWLYGQGFPKSLDVSKAIDKAAGVTREVTREAKRADPGGGSTDFDHRGSGERERRDEPATEAAHAWEGWGTALKPAFEPIVVARKPLAGTVAANVLEHGTGALNVAASRTEATGRPHIVKTGKRMPGSSIDGAESRSLGTTDQGRWPTNVVMDDQSAADLDTQSGTSTSRVGKPRRAEAGDGWGMTATATEYADEGGASRFFPTFRYEPKAPKRERPRVWYQTCTPCAFDPDTIWSAATSCPVCGRPGVSEAHPTVKPLDFIRWLVRLVTPPQGTVVDPFLGSGTTMEAAVVEGFAFIGMEREARYLPLIDHRLDRQPETSAHGFVAKLDQGAATGRGDGRLW